MTQPIVRFMIKVDQNGPTIRPELGPCWVWRGSTTRGYGTFWLDGKVTLAHRASLRLFVGPIPEGLHALHHCDNPPCVRPDHLFVGTNIDNMRDLIAKGRHVNQQKTHCPQGHPYDAENTYPRVGHRMCLTCYRLSGHNLDRIGTRPRVVRPPIEVDVPVVVANCGSCEWSCSPAFAAMCENTRAAS